LAANDRERTSGTQIWIGRRPAERRVARYFWTRSDTFIRTIVTAMMRYM
jgi:hypothetical protein